MFGIGAVLGKVFGSDQALTSIVDSATSALDKLYYSEEEKAEDAAKARSEARAMVIRWMASTQGQNLARRIIALSITAVWLGMYLFSVFLEMLAVVWGAKEAQLGQISVIAKESAQDMNPAVMLILAFYFAAPHMGDIASAALGKMKNRIG